MPYLGDYLGHLLSEITIARLSADLEAVRIAELYAQHPLLRNMPVPRFRLPEVELDVPVVINELEPAPSGGTSAPPVTELRKVFDEVVAATIKEERIELTAVMRTRLKQTLDRTTLALTKPTEIPLELNRVAVELSRTAIKALAETIDPQKLGNFEEKLMTSVQVAFSNRRPVLPRLNALITSAQVKEAGPGEVITRLKLKVVEESFEWTSVETDGDKQDRLVIE